MMDTKDFENFEEFKQKQIAVLKEKGEDTYKDSSYKDQDLEDLYDELYEQMDKFEYNEKDKEYRQRRLLHIANYAFFLYEKLKGE